MASKYPLPVRLEDTYSLGSHTGTSSPKTKSNPGQTASQTPLTVLTKVIIFTP
jgi:hypothetical protein